MEHEHTTPPPPPPAAHRDQAAPRPPVTPAELGQFSGSEFPDSCGFFTPFWQKSPQHAGWALPTTPVLVFIAAVPNVRYSSTRTRWAQHTPSHILGESRASE